MIDEPYLNGSPTSDADRPALIPAGVDTGWRCPWANPTRKSSGRLCGNISCHSSGSRILYQGADQCRIKSIV
jgi:hypothetical protein